MIRAKKSLGQNFLKSQHVINRMVSAGCVEGGDVVLEIGPGKGDLTWALLSAGAHVVAIEKDQDMVGILQEKFVDEITEGRLHLVHGDALDDGLLTQILHQPYKLVANIPYYITGAIIRRFLSGEHQPSTMVLLIQKEVAQRIAGNQNKESILSLSVAVYGQAKLIMKVKPQAFTPQPKVDSAIITVENISKDNFQGTGYEGLFFSLVRAAFSQKRKKAIKNLTGVFSGINFEAIFHDLGIDNNTRAEDIHLDTWLQITQMVYNNL